MRGWNFRVEEAEEHLGPDVSQELPRDVDDVTAQKLYAAGHAIVANLGYIPPTGWRIVVTRA